MTTMPSTPSSAPATTLSSRSLLERLWSTIADRGRSYADVLQPDAALVGGLTGLRRVCAMAQEHNLAFTPHTWTNGLGVVANAHLTAGLADAPFLEYPYDPPEWDLGRRDFMLAEPLRAGPDGRIVLSDKPGFGVDLDEDVLARTRTG